MKKGLVSLVLVLSLAAVSPYLVFASDFDEANIGGCCVVSEEQTEVWAEEQVMWRHFDMQGNRRYDIPSNMGLSPNANLARGLGNVWLNEFVVFPDENGFVNPEVIVYLNGHEFRDATLAGLARAAEMFGYKCYLLFMENPLHIEFGFIVMTSIDISAESLTYLEAVYGARIIANFSRLYDFGEYGIFTHASGQYAPKPVFPQAFLTSAVRSAFCDQPDIIWSDAFFCMTPSIQRFHACMVRVVQTASCWRCGTIHSQRTLFGLGCSRVGINSVVCFGCFCRTDPIIR